MKDDDIEPFRNGKVHPLVEAGAHPLGMWMSVITMQAEVRKNEKSQSEPVKAAEPVPHGHDH